MTPTWNGKFGDAAGGLESPVEVVEPPAAVVAVASSASPSPVVVVAAVASDESVVLMAAALAGVPPDFGGAGPRTLDRSRATLLNTARDTSSASTCSRLA